MKKLVYLPVDERPCNYRFPAALKDAINDIEFIQIPFEKLGNFRKPPKFDEIKEFLEENTENADILVIGLEMLLYGGLVPSRNHHLKECEILERLQILTDLKNRNPNLKIYAFSLIMRCPCYDGSDEEPEYFLTHGREIFLYGELLHKHQLGLVDNDEFEKNKKHYLDTLSLEINDYVSRRNINRNVLIKTLDLVNNVIDFLVIPQDDSNTYGFTTMDRNIVLEEIKKRNLTIPMYPGCDEVGMVLIARAISDLRNYKVKVKCVFPQKECEDIQPIYEDRVLRLTLKSQLDVAGFVRVEKDEDVIMYLNYPTREIVNMGSKPSIGYKERDMEKFNNKIIESIIDNKIVLLCDGAYGNGGEKEWLIDLNKSTSLFDIAAYAGWNTSSNTLGTVLFQGLIYFFYRNKKVNDHFTAERIVEDIGYCGAVRWDVWHNDVEKIGYSYENAGEPNGSVAKLINKKLNTFLIQNFPELMSRYKIKKCEVPWKRLFEIDVCLSEK